MSNLVNGLAFSLSSLMDFEDKDLAERIVNVFLSAPLSVRPKKMGAFEPSIKIADADAVVNLLVNEQGPRTGPRSGSLILEANKDCGFQVQWNKSSNPGFPFIGGHLMFSAISKNPEILNDFLALVRELVVVAHPVYGEVRSMATKGWDAPVNLQVRLPDVPAISIYGTEYVSLFGRDRIETAPFLEIDKVGELYWLVAYKPITEGVPEECRAKIRSHLEESCFMANGKWRYSDGKAPAFDFSRITA